MTGDLPVWFGTSDVANGHGVAARLLRPEQRQPLGRHVLGPLLARTLRGGLFAHVENGVPAARTAIEVSLGPVDDEAHLRLPEIVAKAAHPGLARVFETGQTGGLRWAVVERVHGWPLRVLLGRRGLAFTGRRLAALGAEVADSLAALREASGPLRLGHGRLSVGHVIIDVTGRARLVGSPLRADTPGTLPDAIGLGATLACAALAVAPDPRGLTPATIRALAVALDRPENLGRVPERLRRLVQSLLLLSPQGFLPSMAVLREEFAAHMERLPMGVPDPAWGRALPDAVQGLPPAHRPTIAEAGAVINLLALHLPGLVGATSLRPPPPMLVEAPAATGGVAPKLRLIGPLGGGDSPIHGAEAPEAAEPMPPRRAAG